jgi:S-DNA-T family DNA segregation ATPase FtsK/SpoIIIE
VVELPSDPELTGAVGPSAGSGGLPLVLGPGGDDGALLVVDLLQTGGLLVFGPPGSGRSSALDAFARDLTAREVPVARIGPHSGHEPAALAPTLRPDDEAGLSGWLASLPAAAPAVVLADDVGAAMGWSALAGAATTAPGRAVVVIAAGSAGELAGHYQGPVAALRRSRTGLLLRPGPVEADVLGVRLPRTPVPARPGSGWLVEAGAPTRVQVARRRAA